MPKLFDLFVDLVLNAGTFEDDLTDIKTEAQSVAEEIDSLNKAPEGVTDTKLSNVIGDATTVRDSISDAKKAAEDVDVQIGNIETTGSTVLGGLMDTFAGVAGMLIESVVAGIFEVGAESIEMAAAADSPLADAYKKATETLSVTQDLAKMEIGNALLPVATSIKQLTDNVLSFVFNINDAQKLNAYLDQLTSYEAENLEKVAENLRTVFDAFETVGEVEPASFEEMTAGIESQTEYWREYAAVLDNLRGRGVDSSIISQLATGSVESFGQLKALEGVSDEELQTFVTSMQYLEDARASAAETINVAQLEVATSADGIVSTVADMVSSLDQSEKAELGMGNTMDAIISAIGARVPMLQSEIDTILSMVNEITSATAGATSTTDVLPSTSFGNMYANALNAAWNNPFIPNAKGLGYVPYDGYKAELHRGETVLTRQQADDYRSKPAGQPVDPSAIKTAMLGALSEWAQPVGGEALAAFMTPKVSMGIANNTKGVR